MAIFDPGDKIQRWKYIPIFFKITFGNNETIDLPAHQVTGLSIDENYEEYYFPLIKVKIVVDSDTYHEIIRNKNNCKINMRVDRFYFEGEDTKEKSITKKFINDTFELIMDEGTDDMYQSLKQDENKYDYTRRTKNIFDKLDEVVNEMELYLFKSTISGTKKNINKVLTKCNVSDAIAYLATEANLNNILMSQPDNTQIYDEMLLPPLSILRSLEFIDRYYGLYKQGSMIYFGLDYTYILPYNGKCTAYYSGETTVTNIIIPKSTNVTHQNMLGSVNKRNDKTKNYILADYSSINIQNQSISNNYLNANNIQAIDSYDSVSTQGNSNAVSKDANYVKIKENKTMNPFYTTMYTAQTDAKSIIVSLRLQDFDITAISPNKEYNLIFEDPNHTRKYNGKYIIAGIAHEFLNEGAHMGVSSTVVLRKVN